MAIGASIGAAIAKTAAAAGSAVVSGAGAAGSAAAGAAGATGGALASGAQALGSGLSALGGAGAGATTAGKVAAGLKAGTAIAGAGTSIHGVVEGRQQGKAARKEAERAANLEMEKAAVQNARTRRRASAESQIAISQRQAQAASQEGGTSGTQTAIGAIRGQTANNVGFQQQLTGLSQRSIGASNRGSQFLSRQAELQAFGNLPSQLGFTPGSFLSNL